MEISFNTGSGQGEHELPRTFVKIAQSRLALTLLIGLLFGGI